MNWNVELFNFWHIATLLFALILPIPLHFIMRNKTEKQKWLFMLLFASLNLVIFIYRTVMISGEAWFNIWEELPLHLCNFGLFANVIAVAFKIKALYCFSYCFGSIGAFIAMVIPAYHFLGHPIYQLTVFFFFLQHALLFAFGVLLHSLGFIKFGLKEAVKTTVMLFGFAFIAHGANLLIAALGLGNPNYLFTVDASVNALLNIFYGILPVPFLYLVLVLPIVLLVALGMSIPSLIRKRKKIK